MFEDLDLKLGKQEAALLSGPQPLPIDTAPIAVGDFWGPCLLWPEKAWDAEPADSPYPVHWRIGTWDYKAWHDEDGNLIEPTHWAPLPSSPHAITK